MTETNPNPKTQSPDRSKVFIVHGRNITLRTHLCNFLRSIGLNPIEWPQALQSTGSASAYIGDILNSGMSQAQAIVVLLTGDDEARLRKVFWSDDESDTEKVLLPQARPNVLFEAGMAFGRYPERTILVQAGPLREFSDISGRHVVRLDNSTKRRHDLAERLRLVGCDVDLTGSDWHTVGDFQIPQEPEIIKDPMKELTDSSLYSHDLPELTENRQDKMNQAVDSEEPIPQNAVKILLSLGPRYDITHKDILENHEDLPENVIDMLLMILMEKDYIRRYEDMYCVTYAGRRYLARNNML